MTTGPTGIVVASRPWMLNSSVHAASTAASTTGRYSGLQPAITALIATFSTVHSTRSGGTTATTSSGARVVPVEHPQHACLGRRHDGQAVGPAPVEQRLGLVLERRRARPGGCAGPTPPKRDGELVDDVGSTDSEPQPGRMSGRSAPEAGHAGELLPRGSAPADGAVDLGAVLDPEQRRHGLDVVVVRDARGRRRSRGSRPRGTSGRPA